MSIFNWTKPNQDLTEVINRLRRIENTMVTRSELNAGLDGLLAPMGSLSAAIDALKAAIAEGGDFQAEMDKVSAISAAIQEALAKAQL